MPSRFADTLHALLIHRAARGSALDPALVYGVIFVESRHDPGVRPPKELLARCQRRLARRCGTASADPVHVPEANVRAGTPNLVSLRSSSMVAWTRCWPHAEHTYTLELHRQRLLEVIEELGEYLRPCAIDCHR